jgi:hypothetical protein
MGIITAVSVGEPESGVAPPPRAAEIGRDLPAETAPATATSAANTMATTTPPPPAGGVEPDLDALSRRVYTILRHRLAGEARRSG